MVLGCIKREVKWAKDLVSLDAYRNHSKKPLYASSINFY